MDITKKILKKGREPFNPLRSNFDPVYKYSKIKKIKVFYNFIAVPKFDTPCGSRGFEQFDTYGYH